jgi:hypothetical protein
MSRRAAFAAILGVASLAATQSHALSIRGPGGRAPGGYRPIDPGIGNGSGPRPIDPGIGNGRPGGWQHGAPRRGVIGDHGPGIDPGPQPRRWRNRQGGLLGEVNQPPAVPGSFYRCHPHPRYRRRRRRFCP